MASERALTAPAMSRAARTQSAADAKASRRTRTRTRTPRHILAPRLLFIISTIALVVFGLVMVYSASFVESFTNPNIQDSSYIFRRQVMLVGVGLVALIITLIIDYRIWNSFASLIPWACIVVLLILTWAMGNEALGGRRWVDLFGFNLQPSEFAKIAILLLAGMLLVKLRSSNNPMPILLMIAAAVGLPAIFIILQPDLGTTLIALVGFVAVAYFGELSMKPLIISVLLIALVGVAAILLAGFRMGRIDAWLDPWAYASNEGYQIVNSFYAFAGGGVSGVGLGMSHQKYLYLPQPHNDLIFPIIGEEFGLIGATAVVVLFLVFLYAAFQIARNAPDLYGRVLAGSAAAMIGFQAFLNMLCMVNLLPMTGKPLPFFSAGGSSIIVTLMLVGLVINVSLRSGSSVGAAERRDQLLIIDGARAGLSAEGYRPPKGRAPRQAPGMGGVSRQMAGAATASRQAPGVSTASRQAVGAGGVSRQAAGATAASGRTKAASKQRFRKAPAQPANTPKTRLRRPPARGAAPATQVTGAPSRKRSTPPRPAGASQRPASAPQRPTPARPATAPARPVGAAQRPAPASATRPARPAIAPARREGANVNPMPSMSPARNRARDRRPVSPGTRGSQRR